MSPSEASARICDLERLVLRALCQSSCPEAQSQSVCRELATHRWQEEDHRIVFAALQQARRTSPSSLQQQLPGHATRMGFPDIDWAALFEPVPESGAIEDDDVSRLVADLKAAAKNT